MDLKGQPRMKLHKHSELGGAPLSGVDQHALRKNMRRQRLVLSPHVQRQAAQAIVCKIRHQPFWIHAKKVGLYLDAFGEVPTHRLIAHCFAMGKSVYLPVVRHKGQPLRWARVSRQQWESRRLTRHYFGMHQPHAQRGVSVRDFDCVVMPLLAVDSTGHRLGMGGGFYDRTLAYTMRLPHKSKRQQRCKPYRIGLAYDFQRVTALPTNPWDVGLNALLTPTVYLHI